MKIFLKYTVLTLAVLLVLSAEIFAGGGRRNGTAGAQELLIPVGGRGLSLNGSYIAGIEGSEAIYYNPAGLSLMNSSVEVLFSQMNYIADIGVSYAVVATQFEGFGALGLSIKSIDFGDIPVTTVEAPQGTGSVFSPTYVTIGLTYSNYLTDRISVGANFKLISEKIMRVSATGFAFDAGVMYNGFAGLEGLKIGIVLRNLGPSMSFDGPDLLRVAEDPLSNRGFQYYQIDAAPFELPSQLELGIAYERSFANDIKGLVMTSFENNNFSNDQYKLAAEFSYNDLVFLRGGYAFQPEADDNPSFEDEENIFGVTLGAGVKLKTALDITVDYAYRFARFFDANHLFAVKLGF
ncbi:MAG: PorV/PorQ family protein [Ignavibacteriaceae bacterium]|nr:PorV/PorQ family protein [Ignavibacteriaceae bacterium]